MMPDPIIGGVKRCSEWPSAKSALAAGQASSVWEAAFEDWFHSRIRLRYLQPIELLREDDSQQGEGFSIVAIHCSLVEYLESSVQGVSYRFVRNDEDLREYQYRKSGPIFVSFLTKREPFNTTFDTALAWEFYENIRCGLLHEAATKGGWRIWANGSGIVDRTDRIVFRNQFHQGLLDFVAWYRRALPVRVDLQQAFMRKVDALYSEALVV
jgi:hypothetical protein